MKKVIAYILSVVMTAGILAGCSGDASQTTLVDPQVTSAVETASVTSETTTETTETSETTTEPEKEPEGNMNLLTGTYDLSDEAVGKRPVAVAINNVYEAMPQIGIGQASIIYETAVELELTRLLAIFPDYINLPYIVSVRSYRSYYPAIALGFDAFYVHWGRDESKMDYYYSLELDSFDGLERTDIFGRDQNRLDAGYSLEHTSCFYGPDFADVVHNEGYRTDLAEEYTEPAFKFVNSYTKPVAPAGDDCNYCKIDFGKMWTSFEYNSKTKLYYKINGDSGDQIDGATGEQLAFTNLFILETDIWTRDDGYHKDINWNGGSDYKGYYISDGKAQTITWSKEDEYARLKFFDEEGNELEVNRGKSYIAMCPIGSVELR